MGTTLPLLGLVLGQRYKILNHIGEGAMASVFAGQDLQAGGAPIAIKVMLPHLANDRTFSARFKREAQAASMVKHPNSVAIYAIGEENGIHFIVMELCPGRDLRETLKVERRLPEVRAVRILRCIADALRVAHDLGVIHRDLKPENVMISHDPQAQTDRVKVLDFGIAKLVAPMPKLRGAATDSDPAPAITQFGVVVGTPQYMSPEQVRGHALDGRSDIYTCGILLYQMTTGALPFDGDSPLEIAGRHAFEIPKAPHTVNPSLDPRLDAIIMRLLSKAPDDRPQTAGELADLLELWERSHTESRQPVRGIGYTTPLDPLGARAVSGPFVARSAGAGAPTPRAQLGTLMDLENAAETGLAVAEAAARASPPHGAVVSPVIEEARPLAYPDPHAVAPVAVVSNVAPPNVPQPPPAPPRQRRGSRAVGLVLLFLCACLVVGVGVGLHLLCTGQLVLPVAPPKPPADGAAPDPATPSTPDLVFCR